MANFWNALAQAGPAGIDAFRANEAYVQKQRELQAQRAGTGMFGSAVQKLMQPQPTIPQGMEQAPQRSMMPTALSPQMPGSASIGSSMPGPENAPRAGATAMGPMPQGQPPADLDWRDIITAIGRDNPNADPMAIAAAVDKATPFMNLQSKAEWAQMRAQIAQQAENRKQTQGDTRLDQGQQRLDISREGQTSLADYRAQRLEQADRALAARAQADPKTKMRFDQAKVAYQQAEQTYRSALKGVGDAEYIMDETAQARATAELTKAAQARTKAWGELDKLTKSLGVSDTPGAASPATPRKAAAPGASPANIITTKTGAKAQASGYESPQDLGGAPPEAKTAKPAPLEQPTANTAPVVSAGANNQGQAPTLKPPPLQAAMRSTTEAYNSPRVGPVKWTGTGWVRVKWDGKNWVEVSGRPAK